MSTPDPMNTNTDEITPIVPSGPVKTDQQVELELQQEEGSPVEQAEPKKLGGVAKRLSELTEARKEAQTERDYWRQLAMQAAQQNPAASSVTLPPAVPTTKPEVANFQTYEEYLEALADFKADQKIKEVEQKYERQRQEEQRLQLVQTFSQREAKAKEQYSDYDVVAKNPNLPITNEMAGIIANSERGPDVAYYLGTHPEEAARIANLHPQLSAYELGKIEALLTRQVSQKAVTRAPAPIPGVGSGTSDAPMDSLPTDEWMKRRNQQVMEKNQAILKGRQIVRR